jgi:hypothetical protein
LYLNPRGKRSRKCPRSKPLGEQLKDLKEQPKESLKEAKLTPAIFSAKRNVKGKEI